MCWRAAKRKQYIRSVIEMLWSSSKILSSKSKWSSSNSVFFRSASSFEELSQSCDTHASVHFMPSSMQEHSPGIYFLLHLHAISSKTWSKCKMKGDMNQSSSISVTATTVLSFLKGNVRETDSFKRKCLNESVFLTFPFKNYGGKVTLFLLCVRNGIAHSPYFLWHFFDI